ncbi:MULTISPECIES: hypothetical protein [Marinobacter]|jgi:hypothetical protein|uniref:hypothetical protein n=1 Tax=Marinobacter TaxID=2742 RepID=UPI000FCA65EA|nr:MULTISPECIES: hypothetical protein [Marinobacter]MBJ7277286.1 hypothetical protein [Marinobacter salarius]MDM8180048.1 hypothetical protein [Marinobacter salarius]RUT74145.1 hypothetical protein EHM94_02670 [Marinobacter sp. NP-6]|tara:strand:- start:140 stop:607 length:468 start_codon:yes stop_codon:yes gene_type:complete
MKLHLYIYHCENCSCHFKAPEVPSFSYGEFLLRSKKQGIERYLNAFEDSTYSELNNLLKLNPRMTNHKPIQQANVFRKVYGPVVCDPDQYGNAFGIGLSPICPKCGSQRMASWEATDPLEPHIEDIPKVTHVAWNSMGEDEKEKKLDKELGFLGF